MKKNNITEKKTDLEPESLESISPVEQQLKRPASKKTKFWITIVCSIVIGIGLLSGSYLLGYNSGKNTALANISTADDRFNQNGQMYNHGNMTNQKPMDNFDPDTQNPNIDKGMFQDPQSDLQTSPTTSNQNDDSSK